MEIVIALGGINVDMGELPIVEIDTHCDSILDSTQGHGVCYFAIVVLVASAEHERSERKAKQHGKDFS